MSCPGHAPGPQNPSARRGWSRVHSRETSCYFLFFPSFAQCCVSRLPGTVSRAKQASDIHTCIMLAARMHTTIHLCVLFCLQATASVDPETDAFLTEMIAKLFKNVTTITIAHRLQTIMRADQILVIDKGIVAEQGQSVKQSCAQSSSRPYIRTSLVSTIAVFGACHVFSKVNVCRTCFSLLILPQAHLQSCFAKSEDTSRTWSMGLAKSPSVLCVLWQVYDFATRVFFCRDVFFLQTWPWR